MEDNTKDMGATHSSSRMFSGSVSVKNWSRRLGLWLLLLKDLAWELECRLGDLKHKVKSWYQRQTDRIVRYIQQYPKIAFLLFLEKNPKHSVIESSDIIIGIASVGCLLTAAGLAWLYYGFVTFGVAGFFASFITLVYMALLIPHYIKDR